MSRTEQINRELAAAASPEVQKSCLQLWQALPADLQQHISEDEVIIEGAKNQQRLTEHFRLLQGGLTALIVLSIIAGVASNNLFVAIVGAALSFGLHEWLKGQRVKASISEIEASVFSVIEQNKLLAKANDSSPRDTTPPSAFDVPPQNAD